MVKYILKRLLHGIISVLVVVLVVMLLVYSTMDRELIFSKDPQFTKLSGNTLEAYKYQQWEKYGYLDYVPYKDYLVELGLTTEERNEADFGRTPQQDSAVAKEYVQKFTEHYESKGYTVVRLDYNKTGSNPKQLFAYKDLNVFVRFWKFITGIIKVDNIHNASGIPDDERKITFTLHDPAYNKYDENGNVVERKFAPAIMGNGTTHKYLLYFDDNFPFIHQNLISISLGTSYSINRGVDVWDTMTITQGPQVMGEVAFPTGYTEQSADNLHSATYVEGSLAAGGEWVQTRFTDDYTNVITNKGGKSQMGYSFTIGIISTLIAYFLGLPLGILMALKKDKIADKIGTMYVIFIIAVPSLAYIFMFKAIGMSMGLPITFDTSGNWLFYVLPIISLALPSIGGLMKWMRRYMIDQSNSDYVKFARSGGLSEGQIFRKHIMKNASIPILNGIPGSILASITGAIITERVYVVPGVGNVLTQAISAYDNSVIVGITLFYALLSVVSLILGDIVMALTDPRINFNSKAR